MVDRSNFERLRGFGEGLTDGQTFAIVESLFQLKTVFVRWMFFGNAILNKQILF